MDKQALIKALIDLAPQIITIIGASVASILALLSFIVKSLWKSHNLRIERVNLSLDRLGQYIKEHDIKLQSEHRALWDAIQEIKKDRAVADKNVETLAGHVMKLSFATEEQQKTIQSHIERLIKVDSKLDAVFRFIDTPLRSTDRR